MKKNYQERLNKVSSETGVGDEAGELSPEITELDSILELPHPLRENSLVQAICDGFRRLRKAKPKKRPLAAWSAEAMKGPAQDNQN